MKYPWYVFFTCELVLYHSCLNKKLKNKNKHHELFTLSLPHGAFFLPLNLGKLWFQLATRRLTSTQLMVWTNSWWVTSAALGINTWDWDWKTHREGRGWQMDGWSTLEVPSPKLEVPACEPLWIIGWWPFFGIFRHFPWGNKCDLSSKKVVSYDEAKDCHGCHINSTWDKLTSNIPFFMV